MQGILSFALPNVYSQSNETLLYLQPNAKKKRQWGDTEILPIPEAWNIADFSGQPVGSILKGRIAFLDCLTLKTGPICRPETSVNNCQYRLRNVPEERKTPVHRGGNMKSPRRGVRGSVLADVNKMLQAGGNASKVPRSLGKITFRTRGAVQFILVMWCALLLLCANNLL
jgi:hypothetical protein